MTDDANMPPPTPARKAKPAPELVEAHAPATLSLPPTVTRLVFKESDTFRARLERDRYSALNEIAMLDPQIEALTDRRADLQSIVDSCGGVFGPVGDKQ